MLQDPWYALLPNVLDQKTVNDAFSLVDSTSVHNSLLLTELGVSITLSRFRRAQMMVVLCERGGALSHLILSHAPPASYRS